MLSLTLFWRSRLGVVFLCGCDMFFQIKKITRKVLTKFFRRRNMEQRIFFCDFMLNSYPADRFVWLDETAKDRRSDHRRMARAILGDRAYVEGHFDRGVRHSVYVSC